MCLSIFAIKYYLSEAFLLVGGGLFCLFMGYRELPMVNKGERSGESLGNGLQSKYLSSNRQSQAVIHSKMSPVCWLDTLRL